MLQILLGQKIGRYKILSSIGEGGMATVYLAEDTNLERQVALKMIRAELIPPAQLPRLLERFKREAKALAKLSDDPAIITVHDYGEYEGTPYLVMAYMPGGTLKDMLGNPMDYRVAAEKLIPVTRALGEAHEQGIIHRDVKPSNLLVDKRGQLALADFGIAKALEMEGQTLTGTGLGVGTPEYMAPEQWRGQATPQTDVYALGVVLYEMVTGKKPFQAENPSDIYLKQMTEAPTPPRELVPGLPQGVEEVLEKAMAKEPGARFADMARFGEALRELLDGRPAHDETPVAAVPPRQRDLEATYDELLTPAEGVRPAVVEMPVLQAEHPKAAQTALVREKKSTKQGWLLAGGIGVVGLLGVIVVVGFGSLINRSGNPIATEEAPVEEATIVEAFGVVEEEPISEAKEIGEVLKIGQLSMLSGAMALYGEQQVRGFELGLEYASGGEKDEEGRWIIAGRPVEVLGRDTEGDPEKGVSLALELIEKEGVEIIQGPVSSAVAAALTTVAQENEIILMVDPAASAFTTGEYFNPYVFRTSRTTYDDTLVIAKYLVENVGPTFAHIGIDNAFGQGSGAALKYSVEKFGGEVVADIYAPFDTTDFTPYIQQAMDSGADNLFLTWAGTGYVTLFQALGDLGALDAMTVGTGYGDNASFAAVYGAALGQIGLNVYHYTVPDNEINDWLVKRHKEEYNEPPDLFTAGGMASALALANALEATGGDTSAEGMIEALEGMKFDGPKGTYYIRPEDHVCEQPMNILRLVNLEPDKDGDGINEYEFFETVYVTEYDELGVPCTLTDRYAERCGD